MSTTKTVRLLGQTLVAFGARRGASAGYSYIVSRLPGASRQAPGKLAIPGLTKPIVLRPGTSDWHVMKQIFVDQEYSTAWWPDHHASVEARYRSALEQGLAPVIVDCGANIGLSAVWFAARFPKARIYAVEPEPSNFEILVENARGYPNITPLRAGISDREGKISLSNAAGEHWAWTSREDEAGAIETVTIAGILARVPNSVPLIVKIDIEGSEVELFRSNVEWAEKTPLIVVELHDWMGGWRGTGHAVLSRLVSHPRDYMQRGENLFSFSHDLRKAAEFEAVSRAAIQPVELGISSGS